jgi:hypothetical protein
VGRNTLLCLASWSASRAIVPTPPGLLVTVGFPARRIWDGSGNWGASKIAILPIDETTTARV